MLFIVCFMVCSIWAIGKSGTKLIRKKIITSTWLAAMVRWLHERIVYVQFDMLSKYFALELCTTQKTTIDSEKRGINNRIIEMKKVFVFILFIYFVRDGWS